MGVLGIAGLNAAAFEIMLGGTVASGSDAMPPPARVIGGLSLVSGFAILVLGRLLAFVGGTD